MMNIIQNVIDDLLASDTCDLSKWQERDLRTLAQSLVAKCRELQRQVEIAKEALSCYAACRDGCTCGDGWGHEAAVEALAKIERARKDNGA